LEQKSDSSRGIRDVVESGDMIKLCNILRLAIICSRRALTHLEVSIKTQRTTFSTHLSKRLRVPETRSLIQNAVRANEVEYITTKLSSLQIQFTPQAVTSEFVEEVLRFLRAQAELQDLKVPILSTDAAAASNEKLLLATVLPTRAHTVYFCSDNALYPDIFDALPSLKDLTVHCTDGIARLASALNEKIYPDLRSLTLVEKPAEMGSILLEAFPNLTRLKIEKAAVTDESLQLIIQNLTQLQCLDLTSTCKITDFGVTGVAKDRCKALWDSRSFYLQGKDASGLGNNAIGLPLSSLKREQFIFDY
jgi:hypothetical protein